VAWRIEYKSEEQIRRMRHSGLHVARIHEAIRAAAAPGVSTAELDEVASAVLTENGARSNFLGYQGFPAHVCLSVNSEVVHGIPGRRVLREGDVLSVDCGAVVAGWHADAAFFMVVGSGSRTDAALVAATEEAMWAGVTAMAGAHRVGEIGAAVQEQVERTAESTGLPLSIVTDYVGHGIGTALHQPPDVPNVGGHRGPRIRPGMCLAVEPMLTLGSASTDVLEDDWTVVTTDGSRAAHAEHTVAVHRGGIWVLTAPDGGASALAARGVQVAPLG